ncbi:MAG: zinc ribbon domain-containing protein [Clostridiaceae bacterium]|nr:zinc ribbon domain-containing protein [Clostridiaceae bacterium]
MITLTKHMKIEENTTEEDIKEIFFTALSKKVDKFKKTDLNIFECQSKTKKLISPVVKLKGSIQVTKNDNEAEIQVNVKHSSTWWFWITIFITVSLLVEPLLFILCIILDVVVYKNQKKKNKEACLSALNRLEHKNDILACETIPANIDTNSTTNQDDTILIKRENTDSVKDDKNTYVKVNNTSELNKITSENIQSIKKVTQNFCTSCGKRNIANGNFCFSCGKDLRV